VVLGYWDLQSSLHMVSAVWTLPHGSVCCENDALHTVHSMKQCKGLAQGDAALQDIALLWAVIFRISCDRNV
jgi:hypothetical protein